MKVSQYDILQMFSLDSMISWYRIKYTYAKIMNA